MNSTNPFKIIWAAIWGLFSKENFSWINFTNFANIIIVAITAAASSGTFPMGLSVLIVSVLTAILKLVQSHKEIVSTGYNFTPAFYLTTLLGVLFGAFELFVTGGYITEFLKPSTAMWITVGYSALLMYLRTGFTNQSAKSMLARKNA